jgi:hypothetical protein
MNERNGRNEQSGRNELKSLEYNLSHLRNKSIKSLTSRKI